jgi:hypothetical protein
MGQAENSAAGRRHRNGTTPVRGKPYHPAGREATKTPPNSERGRRFHGDGEGEDGTILLMPDLVPSGHSDSLVETRNGSGDAVKQHVWGTRYIDELVQTTVVGTGGGFGIPDAHYFACQDSNYNVLGVVDSSAVLKERYEYTPYGQRSVLFSPGSNDRGKQKVTSTFSRRPDHASGT